MESHTTGARHIYRKPYGDAYLPRTLLHIHSITPPGQGVYRTLAWTACQTTWNLHSPHTATILINFASSCHPPVSRKCNSTNFRHSMIRPVTITISIVDMTTMKNACRRAIVSGIPFRPRCRRHQSGQYP